MRQPGACIIVRAGILHSDPGIERSASEILRRNGFVVIVAAILIVGIAAVAIRQNCVAASDFGGVIPQAYAGREFASTSFEMPCPLGRNTDIGEKTYFLDLGREAGAQRASTERRGETHA